MDTAAERGPGVSRSLSATRWTRQQNVAPGVTVPEHHEMDTAAERGPRVSRSLSSTRWTRQQNVASLGIS